MDAWWKSLRLRFAEFDPVKEPYRARALARLAPEWFAGPDGKVGLAEAVRLVDAAQAEVERARELEDAARRAHAWMQIEAGFEASDADDVIERGAWTGFTRAQAKAWSWNFVQYIPQEGELRSTGQRQNAQKALEEGDILEIERFAELARELESSGSDPRAYRRAMETLDRETFDETTVLRRI